MHTKIYVHKVRINPEDRWGRSQGIQVDILARFSTKEKAQEHKIERDKNLNNRYFDVGQSWIEEEMVN